ncbi:MAG: 16S rRNA (guanine(527)-N(7))-methyltransferase RsmG, partial [Clostridia bacterium]|nr:16S rRNA (guanine(527)-N(7))-methyltransferase RsmG [Clostridia bacterium]
MDKLDVYLQSIGAPDLKKKFSAYYDMLIEWNNKFNLTAITDKDEVYEKHFIDSMLGAEFIPKCANVCDIGSGAGFPAIPLAMLKSGAKFTAVDSLNKRIAFLKEVIAALDIDNCCACHSRAEDWARMHRESYDVCVARAVAPLNILAEYCLPLVKTGGIMLAYKGGDSDEEVNAARNAVDILGGGKITVKKT